MWMCENWTFDYPEDYDLIIKPDDFRRVRQQYIRFGNCNSDGYNMLIHARSTDKCKTGYRNWGEDKWNELVKRCGNMAMASIGTHDGAFHIDNTDDMRGITLEKLADLMASSDVLVGPSSGPMHYGSLCGIPHVTWSPQNAIGVMSNRERYARIWNPFNTPVSFLEDGGWNPEVNDVVGAIGVHCEIP